jgi:predicted glycoside hydrolase/deacetylase ChbG (UPF0249 family)
MTALLERLGFAAGTRVMLLSCNELGFCHAVNVGIFEVLHRGIPASASLMVPAPWARESAARYRGDDIGVHLTINAEHDLYRWGPLTLSPSLLDGDGGFPRTIDDIWDHADLEEVRRECRAQIERAVLWGFDVTHLDTHLDALLLRPEFFDVYLELATEFALPVRLADADGETNAGFPFRSLADAEGVVFADAHRVLPAASRPDQIRSFLDTLPIGVTAVAIRPAVDSPELRAATTDWSARVHDLRSVVGPPTIAELAAQAGVAMTSYRSLRRLMRS